MPKNRLYAGPPSDHFDGLRFFNPGQPDTDRTLRQVIRWKMARGAAPWPGSVPVTPVVPDARVDRLRITMVGHVTMLIQAAGLNILTDPVWSDRASPLGFAGPKRVTAPGIRIEDLPPIDVVLVSHNHYDHLDLAALRTIEARHHPLFVMPLGNDTIVKAAIPAVRIAVGDWLDRFAVTDACTIGLTRANHWSARGIGDRRMALWCGFHIATLSGSVWFAGDTGYGDGAIFREIRRTFGAPDVALIPIGAYAPRWFMSAQHIDPDEAVTIMTDVEARWALGVHWGTFQLTDEPRGEPATLLAAALARAGIAPARFRAAEPGGIYEADRADDPARADHDPAFG